MVGEVPKIFGKKKQKMREGGKEEKEEKKRMREGKKEETVKRECEKKK